MKSTFVLFFLAFAFQGLSQQIAPVSINSGGMSVLQGAVMHNFTIGEIVVTNFTAGGNSIGSGFTNSAGITTQVTALEEADINKLNLLVYPNPLLDQLNIQILESKYDFITITVFDIVGKRIYSGIYSSFNNTIILNSSDWSLGCYTLIITDSQNFTISTYKVIKK